MNPRVILILSAIILLSFNTSALAGQKLYNFDAFFRERQERLEQATRQCAAGAGCTLFGNRAYVNSREPTLGSAILFREGLDLGYRLGPHGVSVYASHMSNAGLDNDNDGMNFVGMRYSFALDKIFRN